MFLDDSISGQGALGTLVCWLKNGTSCRPVWVILYTGRFNEIGNFKPDFNKIPNIVHSFYSTRLGLIQNETESIFKNVTTIIQGAQLVPDVKI